MQTITSRIRSLGLFGLDLDYEEDIKILKQETEKLTEKLIHDNVRTTYAFINSTIGETEKLLGEGLYGEAWLMDDGSVVKITASSLEASCVQKLFDIQEKNPDTFIEYFPKIYQMGFISETLRWAHNAEHIITIKGSPLFMHPVFWFQREEVSSVKDENKSDAVLRREIHDTVTSMKDELGVTPLDTHKGNWGWRHPSSPPIFRDLVCITEGEAYPSTWHQLIM